MQSNNSRQRMFAIHAVGKMYEQMVRQNLDVFMIPTEHGIASISKNELVQMVKDKISDNGGLSIIICLTSIESMRRGSIDSALFMILSEPDLYIKIKHDTSMIDSIIALSPRATEFQQMKRNIPQDLMLPNNKHTIFQDDSSTHSSADDEKVNSESLINEISHEEELNRNNPIEHDDTNTNRCPCQIL